MGTRLVQLIAVCAATIAVVATAGTAHADFAVPAPGLACASSLRDVMTVLPDGTDFLTCQGQGDAHAWAPVTVPFPPRDVWLSYGPEITLHGQGARNPNVLAGNWTASPRDPGSQCGASQVTVTGSGALAPAQASQSSPGQSLSVRILPRLFTISITGDCLWTRNSA